MSEQDRKDEILKEFEPEKREFLRKAILTTAFTAPAIASFFMDGLTLNKANAQVANSGGPMAF